MNMCGIQLQSNFKLTSFLTHSLLIDICTSITCKQNSINTFVTHISLWWTVLTNNPFKKKLNSTNLLKFVRSINLSLCPTKTKAEIHLSPWSLKIQQIAKKFKVLEYQALRRMNALKIFNRSFILFFWAANVEVNIRRCGCALKIKILM